MQLGNHILQNIKTSRSIKNTSSYQKYNSLWKLLAIFFGLTAWFLQADSSRFLTRGARYFIQLEKVVLCSVCQHYKMSCSS